METSPHTVSGQGLREFERRMRWELGGPRWLSSKIGQSVQLSARDRHKNILLLLEHMKTLRVELSSGN